ncbi:MAG TPA: DUF1127 domain-containing protein [Alphaproteobacteria bacterium]
MTIFSQWRTVAGRWVPALPSVLVGTIPAAFSNRLHEWRCRSRGRRDLAEMDAATLQDLGIAPADAWREASKGFWQC